MEEDIFPFFQRACALGFHYRRCCDYIGRRMVYYYDWLWRDFCSSQIDFVVCFVEEEDPMTCSDRLHEKIMFSHEMAVL
jgi:hypothetical protein